MATSPRLKYPFVAGIGMTVYLVTTNVTAAKMAAAASSRVLITSPSLVLDFAPKAKDARTRASWGQSGADPPQPSPHTDLPRSKSAEWCCDPQPVPADFERSLPSTPEFHRATAPERPILDCGSWMLDVSHFIRYPGSNIQDRFVQGPHGLSPPIGNRNYRSQFTAVSYQIAYCLISVT